MNFRRYLSDWEVVKMIDFYRLLDGLKGNVKKVGKLIWKGGSKGIFTVKSAYGIRSLNNNILGHGTGSTF